MALLNPSQLREVLRQPTEPKETRQGLKKLLEDSNLSPQEVLENLALLMRSGDSDSVRLKAAETAAKMNGLLSNDEATKDFTVIININDSQFGNSINPILLPRT